MSENFTPPFPPGPRHSRDPRSSRMYNDNNFGQRLTPSRSFSSSSNASLTSSFNMPGTPTSDESYRQHFPPTPSYTLSPYNSIPATPASPFNSLETRTNFAPPDRRLGNRMIINPDTFEIIDYKHAHFVTCFYETLKTFPPDLFTAEVQRNCVKVLKHVIHQLTELKDIYRKQRDQARLDFIYKEKEVRTLEINEHVVKDAAERRIQAETSIFKDRFEQMKVDLSNVQMDNEHLRKELERERARNAETQINLEALNRSNNKLKNDNGYLFKLNENLLKNERANKERDTNLNAEKEQLKSDAAEEIQRLNNVIEEYTAEKQRLQNDIEKQAAENQKLENDTVRQAEEIEKLQNDIKKHAEQVDYKTEAIGTFAKTMKQCSGIVAKCKNERREKFILKLKTAFKEQKETKAILEEKEKECQALKNQIEDYKKNVDMLEEKVKYPNRKRTLAQNEETVPVKKVTFSLPAQILSPSSSEESALNADCFALLDIEQILTQLVTSQGPWIKNILQILRKNPDYSVPESDSSYFLNYLSQFKQLQELSDDDKIILNEKVKIYVYPHLQRIVQSSLQNSSEEQRNNVFENIKNHFCRLINCLTSQPCYSDSSE
uniref:Uncharacterized protein n=1 Tax=Panagrolaimus sp. ES5 TaxID=591445 RepID=A0AC34FNZ3_9BILA